MNVPKQAVTSAIFDREFIGGFRGGIPSLDSKVLIAKRPKYEKWAPGKYYFPTETYSSKKDLDIRKNNIAYVMTSLAKRGFLKEFDTNEEFIQPNLDYIGWYKDYKTKYTVHVCLGNIWSRSSWKPRKGLGKMLHTTREVPKYHWKTLPDVIEMIKRDKISGEQAVYMVAQEIERRIPGVRTDQKRDQLSRLILDL
jgi:hypothetical protein